MRHIPSRNDTADSNIYILNELLVQRDDIDVLLISFLIIPIVTLQLIYFFGRAADAATDAFSMMITCLSSDDDMHFLGECLKISIYFFDDAAISNKSAKVKTGERA